MTAERFNQQPCPPEVLGYVARMEELMREPGYNHVGVPVELAVQLIKAGTISSLTQFEGCMREFGSRIHFLAVPLDYFGDQYPTAFPWDVESEP